MKKTYYRLILTPESPLHISNGEGEISDSDLIRDERGIPFIPGTGLAGALRALLSDEQAKFLEMMHPMYIAGRYPQYKQQVAATLGEQTSKYILEQTKQFQQWILQKYSEKMKH